MNTEPRKSDNEVDAISTSLTDTVASKLEAQARAMQEEAVLVATKLRNSMTEAAAALQAQMEATAEKILQGLCAAAQGISKSTVKLAETSTTYRDTLLCQPSQASPPNAPRAPHLTPRIKAREGIKS